MQYGHWYKGKPCSSNFSTCFMAVFSTLNCIYQMYLIRLIIRNSSILSQVCPQGLHRSEILIFHIPKTI